MSYTGQITLENSDLQIPCLKNFLDKNLIHLKSQSYILPVPVGLSHTSPIRPFLKWLGIDQPFLKLNCPNQLFFII